MSSRDEKCGPHAYYLFKLKVQSLHLGAKLPDRYLGNYTSMTRWIITTDWCMRDLRDKPRTRDLPAYRDSGRTTWGRTRKHATSVTGILHGRFNDTREYGGCRGRG